MTVDELIKRLLEFNRPDVQVYMNEDLEGEDMMIDVSLFPADDNNDERVVIW